jgi:hypothetical protein
MTNADPLREEEVRRSRRRIGAPGFEPGTSGSRSRRGGQGVRPPDNRGRSRRRTAGGRRLRARLRVRRRAMVAGAARPRGDAAGRDGHRRAAAVGSPPSPPSGWRARWRHAAAWWRRTSRSVRLPPAGGPSWCGGPWWPLFPALNELTVVGLVQLPGHRGGVHARRRDRDDGGDRGPRQSLEPTVDPHTVIRDSPDLPSVQPQLHDSGQSVIQESRIRTMQTEQVVLDRGGA